MHQTQFIMRFLRITITIFTALFFHNISQAQQSKNNFQEPSEVKALLSEKRKFNSVNTVNDKYKIQIFYGSNAEAIRKLADFKRNYSDIDGTIIYTNPSYKVWVGSYKTRIEAERNLVNIKKRFENALLIKPNK